MIYTNTEVNSDLSNNEFKLIQKSLLRI